MMPGEMRMKSLRLAAAWVGLIWLTALQCMAESSEAASETDSPPDVAKADAHGRDYWGPMKLLEGSWAGEIDGLLGQGSGQRRYEFVLGRRYLLMRHDSVRPPQEKSPKGDHHGELSVFSYDRQRETIVLREFMEEGYVLQSQCTTRPDGFVCTAEAIESGPEMQARLTVTLTDAYRFEEKFELASPGEELKVYFTNTWTRIPDFDR